jgi:hypothetical protein
VEELKMSHSFDMASGQVEYDSCAELKHFVIAEQKSYFQSHQQELQLRLLTVAEAEEQQRVPRPRPW